MTVPTAGARLLERCLGEHVASSEPISTVRVDRSIYSVVTNAGREVVLKQFARDQAASYLAEVNALSYFGPKLASPRLLARDDDFLVYAATMETRLTLAQLGPARIVSRERQLTATFGSLLDGPCSRRPDSHAWHLERYYDVTAARQGQELPLAMDAILGILESCPVRPTHRDFQPANLLVARDRILAVDFEFYAPDAPLIDVARLAFNPALRLNYAQRWRLTHALIAVHDAACATRTTRTQFAASCTYWAICCAGFYYLNFASQCGPGQIYGPLCTIPIRFARRLWNEVETHGDAL